MPTEDASLRPNSNQLARRGKGFEMGKEGSPELQQEAPGTRTWAGKSFSGPQATLIYNPHGPQQNGELPHTTRPLPNANAAPAALRSRPQPGGPADETVFAGEQCANSPVVWKAPRSENCYALAPLEARICAARVPRHKWAMEALALWPVRRPVQT